MLEESRDSSPVWRREAIDDDVGSARASLGRGKDTAQGLAYLLDVVSKTPPRPRSEDTLQVPVHVPLDITLLCPFPPRPPLSIRWVFCFLFFDFSSASYR